MNKIIILLALLSSLQCFAKDKHLVFDVLKTLVQGIPKSKADVLNKSELIVTKLPDGADGFYNRYYGVLPHTRESITELSKLADVKISFYSSDMQVEIDTILDTLKLTDASGRSFKDIGFKILYRKDTVDLWQDREPEDIPDKFNPIDRWKKDLTKISDDLDNMIFITSIQNHVLKDQLGTVFYTGVNKYYFDTYYEASVAYQTYLVHDKDKSKDKHFPKNEKEWQEDRLRMDYIYLILKEALEKKDVKLIDSVLSSQKENRIHLSKVGELYLDGKFTPLSYKWIKDLSKHELVGCQEYQTRTLHETQVVDRKYCEENTNERKAYWKGQERKNCYDYTLDLFLIGETDKSNCSDEHVIFDNKSKKYIVRALFFIDGVLANLLPEILDLNNDEHIPNSVYTKYPTELIARSVVMRIHQTKDPKYTNGDSFDYDFYNDSEIHMAFWDQYLNSIKSNCFMNQHQTGHSKGTNNPALRARTEDSFAGILLEKSYNRKQSNPVHVIRPKYAHFMLKRNRPDMDFTKYSPQYGNIIAVLSDKVRPRTTFTEADSLGSPRLIKSLFYKSNQKIKKIGSYYWEAQIWGEVCIDDHVDYFLVNCPSFTEVKSKVIRDLKATGKKVYQCRFVRNTSAPNARTSNLNRGKEL